jgi:putative DNA primase/helicase
VSSRFFDPGYGLKAVTAAQEVIAVGPVMFGVDDRFWVYDNGVWQPGDKEVRRRIVRLLGDRYRPHHLQAIRDVMASRVEEYDIAPAMTYINVYNGMIDWRAKDGPERIHHDERYRSSVQLPVSYVDGAVCPDFDTFLEQAVPPDDVQRVWEMIGYLMMSGNPLQRAFLLTGGGGNGKGVLLEVIHALLGEQNCATIPLHDFAKSQFATAELHGRLANICGEIDATYIESTARIKEIVGDDRIKGERKGKDPFYFKPWCKMIFSANEIPSTADSSRGWWRRFEVINFPNQPARPDPSLKERLVRTDSLRGIAVHAVHALRALMARGEFSRGDAAIRAHLEFRMKNNKLLTWVNDDAELMPGRFYSRQELLQAFRKWDMHNNPAARPMGSTTFYERLRQLDGVREVKIKGVRGFYGVWLHRDMEYVDGTPDDEEELPLTAPPAKVPPEQIALDLGERE